MNVLQRDVRRLKNELQRRDTADADKVRELSIAKEESAICRATLQNIERQLLEDKREFRCRQKNFACTRTFLKIWTTQPLYT